MQLRPARQYSVFSLLVGWFSVTRHCFFSSANQNGNLSLYHWIILNLFPFKLRINFLALYHISVFLFIFHFIRNIFGTYIWIYQDPLKRSFLWKAFSQACFIERRSNSIVTHTHSCFFSCYFFLSNFLYWKWN